MKLYAISDLHVRCPENAAAVANLGHHADDWLILAGDVGETPEHLEYVLKISTERFARVVWTPGNHELWSSGQDPAESRGQARYELLVQLCRRYGVLTPDDPYVTWKGEGGPCIIAPLFLLYDYSFRPPHVQLEDAVAWAMEDGLLCSDEVVLDPTPFSSRQAWCAERCRQTSARLEEVCGSYPLVLVNHFPLRSELVRTPRIPRFSIWCGTTATENWHRKFSAKVVVTGHLHVRATDWVDGVRFEEVSLGYPRQWCQENGLDHYLREILPGPQRET